MTANKKPRILVLGVTGMLGSAVFRLLGQSDSHLVFGSARSVGTLDRLPSELRQYVICGVDVENLDSLTRLFTLARPNVVINCIGLVKQLAASNDPLAVIPINALLPHRLAQLCSVSGSRLIHISTDCVFSGAKGNYTEADISDAEDLYGRSKYLGEVEYPHAITLRTSIIGHELIGNSSLVGWFLAQEGAVRGFKRAVFSGLPTVEMAKLIRDYVIPRTDLHGLYHVSAKPINKFDLLKLIAQVYGKHIEVIPDDQLVIDRSLDSTLFQRATGYQPLAWSDLVRNMRDFR